MFEKLESDLPLEARIDEASSASRTSMLAGWI